MAQMRIFVSHSSTDKPFADALVKALRDADADVWYDEESLGAGHLRRTIMKELAERPVFVVLLSKAALASQWVLDECEWAYDLQRGDPSRIMLPVIVAPLDWADLNVALYLRSFKRVEAGDLRPLPADEVARQTLQLLGLTPQVRTPVSPDAPLPTRPAGPTPSAPASQSPSPASSAIPSDRFKPRLAQLGFEGQVINGVQVIIPPVCAVPAGEFMMGSDPAQDRQIESFEDPQHLVTLGAYQFGRYPVTVAEYACFVRAGHAESEDASTWPAQLQRLDHPVVQVDWNDAVAYAAWLAQLTGEPWRVATEAEWEKAARWDPAARHPRIYPWGDTFDQTRCNTAPGYALSFARAVALATGVPGVGQGTTPVGAYTDQGDASPCGAHDLAGNVTEWTSSLFQPYPYRADDGREQLDSNGKRALRGGNWNYPQRGARAAGRLGFAPVRHSLAIGFRLARTVPRS